MQASGVRPAIVRTLPVIMAGVAPDSCLAVEASVPRVDLDQAHAPGYDASVSRGTCLAWVGSIQASGVCPALGNDGARGPIDEARVAPESCVAWAGSTELWVASVVPHAGRAQAPGYEIRVARGSCLAWGMWIMLTLLVAWLLNIDLLVLKHG